MTNSVCGIYEIMQESKTRHRESLLAYVIKRREGDGEVKEVEMQVVFKRLSGFHEMYHVFYYSTYFLMTEVELDAVLLL